MKRRIYLASSWRNEYQQVLVQLLRDDEHSVYDYKNPWGKSDDGFHWSKTPVSSGRSKIEWTFADYIEALRHENAQHAFNNNDYEAMQWADTCVILLPCGNSAHLEAGWFMGRQLDTFVLGPQLDDQGFEPELMYLLGGHNAEHLYTDVIDLLDRLEKP